MNPTPLLRAAFPLVALGLAVGACSSGSTTASGAGDASTTTSAGSGGDAASGDASSGGAGTPGGDRDVCASVSADQVAEILDTEVLSAEALSVSDTMRTRNDAVGCNYLGKPLAGADNNVVIAEFMDCEELTAIQDDTTFEQFELSGVGERTMARPGLSMETGEYDESIVANVATVDGDDCLFITLFQPASQAQAVALTKAILAS